MVGVPGQSRKGRLHTDHTVLVVQVELLDLEQAVAKAAFAAGLDRKNINDPVAAILVEAIRQQHLDFRLSLLELGLHRVTGKAILVLRGGTDPGSGRLGRLVFRAEATDRKQERK